MQPKSDNTQDRPLRSEAKEETSVDVSTQPVAGEAGLPVSKYGRYSFDAMRQVEDRPLKDTFSVRSPDGAGANPSPISNGVDLRAVKVAIDFLRNINARGLYLAASVAANHPSTLHKVPSIVGEALWRHALEVAR